MPLTTESSSSLSHCMVCLESNPNVPAPCFLINKKNEGDDKEIIEHNPPLCFHQECLEMVWASQNSNNLRCPHCNISLQEYHPSQFHHIIQLGKHKIQGMLHSWLPYSRKDYINVECCTNNSSSSSSSSTNTTIQSILDTTTCNHNNNNTISISSSNNNNNDLGLLSPVTNTFWIRGPNFIIAKRDAPMNSDESNLVLSIWTDAILQVLSSYSDFSQQPSSTIDINHSIPITDPNNSIWKCLFVNLNYNIRISVSLVRTAMINSQGSFIQDGFVLMADHCRYLPNRSCRSKR